MFTKPANEIDFNDIEVFCGEWGEGVRVEYKREMTPKSLPKIISSFANTQGGIVIIGVEADKKQNKVRFPIQGIPNDDGLEERIVQSAITGIYPSVRPEVITCDVPGETGNVVAVVRVEESQQAPHAIQNSTRVYVREGSVTQPYELADIGRIEYLLKRREEPQSISRQILERIEERVKSHCSHLDMPNLELIARPVFPYRPLMSPSEVHEFMVLEPLIPTTDRNINLNTRRVTGGVCCIQSMCPPDFWELNEYGFMYHRMGLSSEPFKGVQSSDDDEVEEERFLHADDFERNVYIFLENVKDFLERCQYLGNIEITVTLREIQGEKLRFPDDRHPSFAEDRESLESEASGSVQCLPQDLKNGGTYAPILIGLMDQLFWVFNVRDDKDRWREDWRMRVEDRVKRLVK